MSSGDDGQSGAPPAEGSSDPAAGGEQLALIRETVRKAKEPRAKPRTWRGAALAAELPVARVLVDKGLLHLDQFFDYAVPAAMDADARPGVRVRVRFGARVVKGRREGGTLHDGFIVERREESDYRGPLAPLAQVLSAEPVLTPALLHLCRTVADRYAGALADVVKLAVPPRMARAESPPARGRGSAAAGPGRGPAPRPGGASAGSAAGGAAAGGAATGAAGGGVRAAGGGGGARPGAGADGSVAGEGTSEGGTGRVAGRPAVRGDGVAGDGVGTDGRSPAPGDGLAGDRAGADGSSPGPGGGSAGHEVGADGPSPGPGEGSAGDGAGVDGPSPGPGGGSAGGGAVVDGPSPGPGEGSAGGAGRWAPAGTSPGGRTVAMPPVGSWARYATGGAYLQALGRGDAPRAVWLALPGPHWPEELATAMAAALASGRGALAVVPDGRAAARVDAALIDVLGEGHHVVLTADAGPEERYRRWLAVSRGTVRAVVGTRAAMFAPVADLGLIALWDDGDSSHAEPHAPYPHARDVLLLRAAEERTGFLLGGLTSTVEGAQLVDSGWALPLAASRDEVRAAAPLIRTVGDADQARDEAARAARLPTLAWNVTRDALARGPVLVQVPRRGYLPRLACDNCRQPARCTTCAGPLEVRDQGGTPACGWCGRPAADWHCQECGGFRLRAQIVGARRTAEELGRAFPRVPVRTSGRDTVLASVGPAPALVIATPGAEPVAEGGYAAALLLDGWALLNRPDLRAGEEALRRWALAAALVRPADEHGTVVVLAEPTLRPVQALVRWDPAGHALRELAERAELRFPPVSRMASVTGPPAAIADLMDLLRLPEGTDLLGPVPLPLPSGGAGGGGRPRRYGEPPPGEQWERLLLRVPPGAGGALAAALKAGQVARAAQSGGEAVFVRMDPTDIG
ncbi:primosomal protein N' [Streptomyces sp. CA-111067]|uniref:primosomal protein N' n=1 Tax=Streptomyces sp. CA-111067 TaxID=3240046 RepID=UPI003D9913C5